MKNVEYKAACTWGDGPDILMTITDNGNKLFYDLTVDQALKLAAELEMQARNAQGLERLADFQQLQELRTLPMQTLWRKGQRVVIVGGETIEFHGNKGSVMLESQLNTPYWTFVEIDGKDNERHPFRSEELRLMEVQ